MIIRARYVLPMDAPPIRDGNVLVEGERIVAVSSSGAIPDVDLGEAVLFPGLINAHCHLDYTDMLGLVPWRGDFRDWILQITALKKQWTEDRYLASINHGLAELARTGTTSVVNIECYPKLVARLAPTPLRVWWCVELLDLTWSEDSRRMVEHADRWLKTQPRGGLAPHAPYTTSAPLYRLAARTAREHGWLLTTHLAETRGENEMFRLQGDPVSLAELGVLGTNCVAAHGNHLSDAEAESLARAGGSVVHCPRAHRFFGRGEAPWGLWRRAGLNSCLGTDSLASNESLDLRAEMRTVTQFPARDVLAMATVNAAKALNCEGKLGKIAVGSWADLAAVPLDGDPYESVARSEKPVCFSMVGGKVVQQ
ncbi:MAG: amidohydrolase family protein [Verrucomicrobia bacterium]|nr:amidohydrolase family protein [Verrucomicrobiota bacterium]